VCFSGLYEQEILSCLQALVLPLAHLVTPLPSPESCSPVARHGMSPNNHFVCFSGPYEQEILPCLVLSLEQVAPLPSLDSIIMHYFHYVAIKLCCVLPGPDRKLDSAGRVSWLWQPFPLPVAGPGPSPHRHALLPGGHQGCEWSNRKFDATVST
jgi:hypothetical protein